VLRDIPELKRRERELREKQVRSQELLLNILPENIVDQLDGADDYVADTFDRIVNEQAVELQAEVSRFQWDNGEPFQLRIGINSGPLV
jgi:hypothetical protein